MRLWQLASLVLACLIGASPALAANPPPAAAEATGEPIVGEPEPQSFDVFAGSANASTANRGIIGGGGYYHARVTIAPRYEVPGDGTVRIALDAEQFTAEVVQRQDPGGLALLGWSFDLLDMDDPARLVRRVTAHFDNGETATSEQPGARTYVFEIPPGADALESFEVDWAWGANQKTLQFEGYEAPGSGWLPWLLLFIPAGLLAYYLKRPRPPPADGREGEEKPKARVRLSFPEIENDRPEQLLYAHELAADANGGDTADPRPRTRLRIEYVPEQPDAPPFDREFRLRVRCADPTAGEHGRPAASAELFLRGRPVGDRLFMLSNNRATVELRCEPRAEGWEVTETDGTPALREIPAARFIVELETEDGEIRAQSPEVTIVHGAPAEVELADGPKKLGLALGDLKGIDGNALELGRSVGVVHGRRFMWPSSKVQTLDKVELPLGADRLLPSGLVAESEADGNKPVPMGTAVLVLFTVRDAAGNPVRLLEADGHGYYQPSFWIERYWGGGLRPFFLTPTGHIEDPEGTRWVARPTVASVLPIGAYGTLFVPASADFDLLNTTYFNVTIARAVEERVEPVLEKRFGAQVEATPFANKWARWLLSGDVEDLGTFGAELFISLVPVVGDGRDLVIHLGKELSSIKKTGLMDRLVAVLALAGLTLDIANILTAGGATPIDAAVAALKATAKLLRNLAKPKVMMELWQGLSGSLGRETAALLAARAGRAAEALAEELFQRVETFLVLADRGVIQNTSDAVVVLRKTFGDFEAFGEKVRPYLSDTQKMQQLLSLMGMALAAVQLKDILALFVRHSVDEVIDLLTALILMDELDKQQPAKASHG